MFETFFELRPSPLVFLKKTSGMGQNPLYAPSVFNFYSTNYVIPGTTSFGPEFQLLTTATSLNRVNWVNTFVFGSMGSGNKNRFFELCQAGIESGRAAGFTKRIAHARDDVGRHEEQHRHVDAKRTGRKQQLMQEAQTAIYLIASSSQNQVQH